MVVVHSNHGRTWRVIGSRSWVFGDGCGTRSVEVRAAIVLHSVEEELDESESFGLTVVVLVMVVELDGSVTRFFRDGRSTRSPWNFDFGL